MQFKSERSCSLTGICKNVQIVDLGAKNGTYVNEKRIDRKEKKHINVGDVVRFGNTSYELIKIK